jgi:hypothetical protein
VYGNPYSGADADLAYQCMFCTLLLQAPDFPPVAGRMLSAEPAPPPGGQVAYDDQRWTYGYRLIENTPEGQEYQTRFTPLLCDTIARCLMAKQEHRPDLVTLQNTIAGALGNPPPRLPGTVRRFFGSDAPPPVPWYSTYSDADLAQIDPFDPYPEFGDVEDEPPDTPPRRRRRTRQAPEDQAYRP